MSLLSKLNISVAAELSKVVDHGTVQFPANLANNLTLTNGTGANQGDLIFSDQRTLAASANEELDLSGSLLDALGDAVVFAKVKAIIVKSAAANGGNLQVGGAAANGFNDWVGAAGDFVVVKPGGALAVVAPDANGYAVTAGTGDLLHIENVDGSNSATYDIVIIGTSA